MLNNRHVKQHYMYLLLIICLLLQLNKVKKNRNNPGINSTH
jgi:hypothetical protein